MGEVSVSTDNFNKSLHEVRGDRSTQKHITATTLMDERTARSDHPTFVPDGLHDMHALRKRSASRRNELDAATPQSLDGCECSTRNFPLVIKEGSIKISDEHANRHRERPAKTDRGEEQGSKTACGLYSLRNLASEPPNDFPHRRKPRILLPPMADKNRLSQVQSTDLSQSRINDDLVYWLKTKGSNYLLVVLIAVCAFLGWNLYREKQRDTVKLAWNDLAEATTVEDLEAVAKAQAHVPQIAMLALLAAGDMRLQQLQSGFIVRPVEGQPAQPLDETSRKVVQDAADDDYAQVIELAKSVAQSGASGPVVIPALIGRAAVAESRGDFVQARAMLEQAASATGGFTALSKVTTARLASLASIERGVALPPKAAIPVKASMDPVAPDMTGDILRSLEMPATAPAPTPEPAPAPTGG